MNVDELAERFYDASLDPDAWLGALDELAFQFGGRGATVINVFNGLPCLGEVTPGLTHFVDLYLRQWASRDAAVVHVLRHGLPFGISCDQDYLSDAFRAANDFYQEFRRPQGIGGILSLITSPFEGTVHSINIQRSSKAGPVTIEERQRLAMIGRHVSRASAIRMRLQRADAIQTGLAARLSDFDCAVAVVDRRGRLLLANAAFDALSNDGLCVRGGFVRVHTHGMQERLEGLIVDAFDQSRSPSSLQPDTLPIARPGSLLPLLVRAMPMKAVTAERLLGTIPVQGVLLVVLNPSHPAYPDVTKALVMLGLTPGQSRVAVLIAGGLPTKATAEQLGITEETVRTTMKHLYQRLGISRQVELARLVAKAAPFRI